MITKNRKTLRVYRRRGKTVSAGKNAIRCAVHIAFVHDDVTLNGRALRRDRHYIAIIYIIIFVLIKHGRYFRTIGRRRSRASSFFALVSFSKYNNTAVYRSNSYNIIRVRGESSFVEMVVSRPSPVANCRRGRGLFQLWDNAKMFRISY